jgi:cobalt-zinc-cadmium efflux system protein
MSHDHHHQHHGAHRSLWWLTALSASYMIAEVIGGLYSGSLALIADAGHMAVDVGAILLSLFALWVSGRPPTPAKTYGYYRAEILAALVNGAALLLVAAGIYYEAWHRLFNPQPIRGGIMAAVAAGGLLVNLIGLTLVHRSARDNLNLRSVWLHLLTDALGSVASLVAAGMVLQWNFTLADPVISMLIGVLILYGAFHLVSECVNVLLVGVPKGTDIAEIRKWIESAPSVDGVHDLHVWTVTNGVTALSAHLRIKAAADHCGILTTVIGGLKQQFKIEHVTLQLEPPEFCDDQDAHLHA